MLYRMYRSVQEAKFLQAIDLEVIMYRKTGKQGVSIY